MNAIVSQAFKNRDAQFEKKQAKAFEDFGTKLTETLTTTLTELSKREESKETKTTHTDIMQSPEFRAMQKQLTETDAKLKKAELDRATERAQKREEALNRRVESELATLGISDPESARILLQGKKLVSYEEEDGESVIFRDEEGGALPLKKGLSDWAKSAVGKRFMPATGANGSGERPASGKSAKPSANGSVSSDELGQAIADQLGISVG